MQATDFPWTCAGSPTAVYRSQSFRSDVPFLFSGLVKGTVSSSYTPFHIAMITKDDSCSPVKGSPDRPIPPPSQPQSGSILFHSAPDRILDSSMGSEADNPPDYQSPFPENDNERSAVRSPSVPSTLHFAGTSTKRSMPVLIEADWYETLRELQANIVNLRMARGRASSFPSHASSFRNSRGAKDNEREIRVLEELILAGMRRLARTHPDPAIQAEWASRAEEFSSSLSVPGDEFLDGNNIDVENPHAGGLHNARRWHRLARFLPSKTDSPFVGLAKGIGITLATPFILAGTAVFGAGAIVYGAGRIVVGIGQILSCGKLR